VDTVAVAAVSEQAAVTREDAEGAVVSDGQPKRKRSRRGSRGGRKRRKPAASGEGPALETADELVGAALGPSSGNHASSAEDTVPEYVPMSEWIEDFDSRS
jgi:hypothetical protein